MNCKKYFLHNLMDMGSLPRTILSLPTSLHNLQLYCTSLCVMEMSQNHRLKVCVYSHVPLQPYGPQRPCCPMASTSLGNIPKLTATPHVNPLSFSWATVAAGSMWMSSRLSWPGSRRVTQATCALGRFNVWILG